MRFFKRDPDPFAPNRFDGIVRSYRAREHRFARRWYLWAGLAAFLVVAVFCGYLVWKYFWVQRQMHRNAPDNVSAAEEGEPFNVLLVGSDSREGLTEQEQLDLGANAVGGERADTLILAHVDPAEDTVVMVQFPRDLWITLPGQGEAKINSALSFGPDFLVRTVEELTGLDVNRYVQVNIAGFKDLVDKIGGVEICITEPIPFDPNTGIQVTEDELGMVHFDGDRALRFVRSRNFTTGDFERIRNQQRFLAAALNKVTSSSTLASPTRINGIFDVAGQHITTDRHTSITDLRRLAQRFRDFDPQRYEAYVVPNLGIGAEEGQSVVIPDPEAMDLLFEAIGKNESPAEYDGVPAIEPSTVSVGVYNSTGEEGAAAAAAEMLTEATDIGAGPVDIALVDVWFKTTRKQLVVFDPDKPETGKMAELVAAAIPGAEIKQGSVAAGVDVAVVVGDGFEAQPIVQLLPIQLPAPSKAPAICR